VRMGGFIVGGLVGAAAAVYFSNNNRPKLMSAINWNQAVDKAGQFAQSAKSMWDTSSIMQNTVTKDPVVKQEVDKILEENNIQQPMQTN